MSAPPVTLCVITKDEEQNLADCLASVLEPPGLIAETVVLDSGSTDRTREIAESFGARTVVHPFDGHVQQKNRAVELAGTEWILSLDADERLSPALAKEIAAALQAPDLPAAFSMPRRTFYLGRFIRHGDWYPDRKIRLFRKSLAKWGGTNPHDRVEVKGEVRRLSGDILHYSYRSIGEHVRQIDRFTSIAAREKHAQGRRARWWRLWLSPPLTFLRGYVLRGGFLDGRAGFVVAVLGSYYVFLKYAKLMEIERDLAR